MAHLSFNSFYRYSADSCQKKNILSLGCMGKNLADSVLDPTETLVHSGFGDGKDGVPFLQMDRLDLPTVNKGFGNPQRITIKDILFLCEVMMMQKEDKKKAFPFGIRQNFRGCIC